MFSGLVWVGMLTAFGRSTFTVLLMTGIVMRKMINSTSITSTSGVVLMLAMAPPDSCPTLIAMVGYSLKHPVPAAQPCRCARLLDDGRSLGRGRTHATGAAPLRA